jgi:hypothetical protein
MDLQRHSMARHCRSQTHQELVQINPFDKLLQFQKKHKWDTIKLIVYGLKTFRETDKYYDIPSCEEGQPSKKKNAGAKLLFANDQEEEEELDPEDPYKSEEANEEEKEEQLDQVAPGVPEPLEVKHVHFLEPQAESCNCEIGDH